ncbi:N-acetylmuramic acid 6-phosphate etherase, partial [Pseudorhodobacter sp.]|uniref:N-acetylmuramic acid 6-phosphate etherase n=1 Tax=Pseudorhodobacter sp. TaxID=1934400 RepID=UPI002648A55F
SGTTPYALSLAQAAKRRGATVIAIANTPGSSLLGLSDIAVCLPTGPEAIAGSTRLGAGTAQKIALNMISTLTGVLLGHVHDGMMVNLNADNIKLRKRAATIVRTIADVSEKQAESALHHAGHATKDAVLIALGASAAEARALLAANDQHLAPCLDVMASRAQS